MICENISINAGGHLTFAGQDTVELAERYGTPLYLIDEARIRNNCRQYLSAMKEHFGGESKPLFASKSLCFKRIYEIIKDERLGIDVVSSGELFTAVQAGFPVENAYFHGNAKTDFDISYGMDCGVGHFVCDNADELTAIEREAAKRGIEQKILIRLTPNIDPHTHEKIATGKIDSKFGVAIETGQARELTRQALSSPHIRLEGFHAHIGSQIFDCTPFCDEAAVMVDFMAKIKEQLGFEASVLNLGGGMAVRYTESDPQIDYAENIHKISVVIKERCAALGLKLPTVLMEPGRSIVAAAGMTLYTATGKKEIPDVKNYLSVDGGMPDNPRYALYQSPYTVINASKADKPCSCLCTVAGRCCESGDLIQENVRIAEPSRGDVIAVLTTGAYNYTMSSNYNAIARPPIVMLNEGGSYIAVRRETFEDLTRCQL